MHTSKSPFNSLPLWVLMTSMGIDDLDFFLSAFMDDSSVGVVVLDCHYRYVTINQALAKMNVSPLPIIWANNCMTSWETSATKLRPL